MKGGRRIYRMARNLPDRVLHRRRHADAVRRLTEMTRPRRILVVCHGNICRSPYLQAVLQKMLSDILIDSAGFVGSDRPVPEFALLVSAERGFDLGAFRSRPVTGSITAIADLAIVMDHNQSRDLNRIFNVPFRKIVIAGDLDPAASATRAIRDPWQQSADVFRVSFDRLDRCAATLAASLRDRFES